MHVLFEECFFPRSRASVNERAGSSRICSTVPGLQAVNRAHTTAFAAVVTTAKLGGVTTDCATLVGLLAISDEGKEENPFAALLLPIPPHTCEKVPVTISMEILVMKAVSPNKRALHPSTTVVDTCADAGGQGVHSTKWTSVKTL